jgi:Rrf2 family protein
MFLLAVRPGELLSVKEAAASLRVSGAHLSKVLQRLAKVGLVKSVRGPKGGFALSKASNRITLLEVYETIEGPLISSRCLLEKPICGGINCILGGLPAKLNEQVRTYLAKKTLADVAKPYQRKLARTKRRGKLARL